MKTTASAATSEGRRGVHTTCSWYVYTNCVHTSFGDKQHYCACDQFPQWQGSSLPQGSYKQLQTMSLYNISWITFLLELFLCSASLCSHTSLSMSPCGSVQWRKIQLEYLASINSKDIQHGPHVYTYSYFEWKYFTLYKCNNLSIQQRHAPVRQDYADNKKW